MLQGLDMHTTKPVPSLDSSGTLIDELLALRESVGVEGDAIFARWRPRLGRLSFQPSAHNLASYLAFRRHDVRALQDELATWGLSSLGRSEGRILASLDTVAAVLAKLLDQPVELSRARRSAAAFKLGERLLERHTRGLLGELEPDRATHVMVTLPERAETDQTFVDELLARGMTSARINCAHGTHDQWRAMVSRIRAAEAHTGHTCRVVMDLSGPRARTLAARSTEDRKVVAGDRILLRATPPDEAAAFPFQVQCTPASILDALPAGAKLSIDEARIEARVESKVGDGVIAEILRTAPGGVRLKPEKALNFPGTELGIPALTKKDLDDLDVVVENADIIGYSFVQDEADVDSLWHEIERRRSRARRWPLGLILKIETERAVRHLPDLIVAAGGRLPVGVMIARGDLAVEVGFERLAELQEEILWLAEAAHTPVIWATQVLDRLVRKGTPSRAEISDVVLAQRAECVMLNKGEFVLEAVSIVEEVCRRMGGHQHKKTARLRALRAWS
jgi:pyruvate kinase